MHPMADVFDERDRQNDLWCEQNHPIISPALPYVRCVEFYLEESIKWKNTNDARVGSEALAWDGILLEEVFEALSERDPDARRKELVEVAAVAIAMIESEDRKYGRNTKR